MNKIFLRRSAFLNAEVRADKLCLLCSFLPSCGIYWPAHLHFKIRPHRGDTNCNLYRLADRTNAYDTVPPIADYKLNATALPLPYHCPGSIYLDSELADVWASIDKTKTPHQRNNALAGRFLRAKRG